MDRVQDVVRNPGPPSPGASSGDGEPWKRQPHLPQFKANTKRETLKLQGGGGRTSNKLKKRNLVLRCQGRSLPTALPKPAPPTPIPELADGPGPCVCLCLWTVLSRSPREVHCSNWFSWISLDKEQGGRGGGRGLEEPRASSSLSHPLPSQTVQAAGWLAWPFRALILARK